MSKPRYDWWGYVRRVIGKYPHCQRQQECMAIKKAVEYTQTRKTDGDLRMELIRLMYWAKNTYSLPGAAMKLPGVSEATAKRWHKDFILTVAQNMGFLEAKKNEPKRPTKKCRM